MPVIAPWTPAKGSTSGPAFKRQTAFSDSLASAVVRSIALTWPLAQGDGRGALRGFLPLSALLRGLTRLKGDGPNTNSRAHKKKS